MLGGDAIFHFFNLCSGKAPFFTFDDTPNEILTKVIKNRLLKIQVGGKNGDMSFPRSVGLILLFLFQHVQCGNAIIACWAPLGPLGGALGGLKTQTGVDPIAIWPVCRPSANYY